MKYMKTLFLLILLASNTCVAQEYPAFECSIQGGGPGKYYFLCPVKTGSNPQNIKPSRLILDSIGSVIYYKINYGGLPTGDFKLQPDGRMSYSFMGRFYLMDSNFVIRDSIQVPAPAATDLHDLQIMPNGHYLLLGNETLTMDLSQYNLFNQNGSPGSSNAQVTCGIIYELDAQKNVVWEWHAAAHYAFDDVNEDFLNNPQSVDWTHFNAVERDAGGNILVSSRHFCEITKIDRSTGSIIWRLGGKRNQFTFSGDSLGFYGQHDIRRLPNGHITLFDNGRGNISSGFHPASGKEYILDEVQKTASLVWNYTDRVDKNSTALGNMQRTQDGYTLINYGMQSNNTTVFNVVDMLGNKVFEMVSPDDLCSYRAFCYPDLPFKLRRPEIACYLSGDTAYLDAGPGHNSYLWSDGSTGQRIAITDTGNYHVFVPVGKGGFIRSRNFRVSDISSPCHNAATGKYSMPEAGIWPNPSGGMFNINLPDGVFDVRIYTLEGMPVFQTTTTGSLVFFTPAGLKGMLLLCITGQNNQCRHYKLISY